jgi:hypothetical protein
LARRQRLEIVASQVFGNEVVETVLAFLRGELFDERESPGVRDITRDLPAQRAMADRFQPVLERLEDLLLIKIDELLAKAFQITKSMFISVLAMTFAGL